MSTTRLSRRNLLRAGAAAAALGPSSLAVAAGDGKPRFLIVVAAAGGGSIIDGLLAIRRSESSNADTLNVFEDAEVKSIEGSPFRATNVSGDRVGAIPFPWRADQESFVRRHKDQILVSTTTGTSVNHNVAQRRSITGNEAWSGRTLQEIVAQQYGAAAPLPNINMAAGGYREHGYDKTLAPYAVGEPVADPTVFPLSLSGYAGIGTPQTKSSIDLARALRNEKLDLASPFARTFKKSARLARWDRQRVRVIDSVESQDLLSQLLFLKDTAGFPLSEYGLKASPDAERVWRAFPGIKEDPLDAQAALTYLLVKNRLSSAVTISPSFSALLNGFSLTNPPLAFDYSHNAHRATQAIMWSRLYRIIDGLIALLKEEPFDETTGESFWDRTMIYVATEFGREKRRAAGATEFSTSHHLNNGVMMISPMVRGNTVLGGVDPETALTYGYDPLTGAPDPGRTMSETTVFSGILEALQIDKTGSGLPSVPIFRA